MSIKTELKPKLEEVHDLDPLADVEPTIAYFHGCLGVIEAEKRLKMTGKNGAYLLRESDVKQNIFIISSINYATVTHFVVPNDDGKYLRQTFKEAFKFIEDVVRSCEEYLYPVPPFGPLKSFDKSEARMNRDKCYCCSYINNNTKVLGNHKKNHKLERCDQCSKYMKKATMQIHKTHCNIEPEELERCDKCSKYKRKSSMQRHKRHCIKPKELCCNLCSFTTIDGRYFNVHRKIHESKPFLCVYKHKYTEGNCRKTFKTEEELRLHTGFHNQGEGFQCRFCGKTFNHKYHRTRHMERMHHPRSLEQRPKGRTMYKCQYCEYKSHRMKRIQEHQICKHTELPPKKYHNCESEFCDFKANYPYLLKRHMETCKKLSNKPVFISMIGEETICMQ